MLPPIADRIATELAARPAQVAAAIALLNHTDLSATDMVKKSLEIAGEICIYTNMNHTIESL